MSISGVMATLPTIPTHRPKSSSLLCKKPPNSAWTLIPPFFAAEYRSSHQIKELVLFEGGEAAEFTSSLM